MSTTCQPAGRDRCQRALGAVLAQCRLRRRKRRCPGAWSALAAPGPLVVVDYAHTPMRWTRRCRRCCPLAGGAGGQLWCVFGCGGDRDAAKRPLMGADGRKAMPTAWSPATTRAARDPRPSSPDPGRHRRPRNGRLRGTRTDARAIAALVSTPGRRRTWCWPAKGQEYQEVAASRPHTDSRHGQARRPHGGRVRSSPMDAMALFAWGPPCCPGRLAGQHPPRPASRRTTPRAACGRATCLSRCGRAVSTPTPAGAGCAARRRGGLLAERGAEAGPAGGLHRGRRQPAALRAAGGRLAAQFACRLIAVTGSNGKTTVTQMIGHPAAHGEERRSRPRATSTTPSACR